MKTFAQIKKLNYLILSFTFLAIFFSCEQEEIVEDYENSSLDSKYSTELRLAADCTTDCIEPGSEVYFPQTDSKTVISTDNTRSKTVSYSAYNTEDKFIVEVLYKINFGSNSGATITIDIDGDVVRYERITSGTTVTHMIDLPEGWMACDEIPFKILQERLIRPIEFIDSYQLIGICPEEPEVCDEAFSYVQNEDGSYTFSYTSEEDLDDAVIKLTVPQISGYTSLDGKIYSEEGGNNNGKAPTNLIYTGDIDACSTISFTLELAPDCSKGNDANIFTDFSVNGVSKKGETGNIKVDCN